MHVCRNCCLPLCCLFLTFRTVSNITKNNQVKLLLLLLLLLLLPLLPPLRDYPPALRTAVKKRGHAAKRVRAVTQGAGAKRGANDGTAAWSSCSDPSHAPRHPLSVHPTPTVGPPDTHCRPTRHALSGRPAAVAHELKDASQPFLDFLAVSSSCCCFCLSAISWAPRWLTSFWSSRFKATVPMITPKVSK